MPFIRFKGFGQDFLRSFAPQLSERFADITGIDPRIVKIELLQVEAISETPRSVEILMFPRPQAVHDAAAAWLYKRLKEYDYPNVHIYYIPLMPNLYYKEGKALTDYVYNAPQQLGAPE